MKVAIVGGGIGGLAAGHELCKLGHQVTLFESTGRLGGLATAIEIAGSLLEGTYHHIFKSDVPIQDLIRELGLEDRMVWLTSPMGFFSDGKIYNFATPLDLLRYKPLSLVDRLKFGFSALYFQRLKDWSKLENYTVEQWVERYLGSKIYEKIWKPLLCSKFGNSYDKISAAWLWGRINPRSKSRSKGGTKEELGYMLGSFQVLFDKLGKSIEEAGGKVHLRETVREISTQNADPKKYRIRTSKHQVEGFDQVLITIAPPLVPDLVKEFPDVYKHKLMEFDYMGAVLLIMALPRQMSNIYWMNISDPQISFGGLIEQTNFIDKKYYNNKHILYAFNYLPQGHDYFSLSEGELLKEHLPSLHKVYGRFDPSEVLELKKFQVNYATPIYTQYYSQKRLLPDTPLPGIYLANITQIYPEDRNMNNTIVRALEAVKLMHIRRPK